MAIGETFLSAVLQVVFDRLASKQVVDFFKSSKLDPALVKKLKHLMEVAGNLLADAEQKQITDNNVKLWLDDLKHLFYRAEEIADQIATEAMRSSMNLSPEPKSFGSKVWNLIPAYSSSSSFASAVNSQLSEVVTQLDYMVSHSVAVNLKEGSASVNTTSRRETISYLHQDDKVFGRDQEKKELLKLLFSEEAETNRIGVVAIVGMGGMGKTTLAKLVYNDESLKDFDLKAWVYVSDHFDISRVMRSILESITGQSYSGPLTLESIHHELTGNLREKRFILVLDDVWNDNYQDLISLLAPLSVGAHGSKIIVTTRIEEVASKICTVPVIHLKPLSNEDGWLLFSKHANLSSDRYESYGREIVERCQGLALAIKTLGGLLRSQEDIRQWEAVLKSSLWEETKGNVAPALRLSYYHLPSHLKRCFSYCAIFPKGYEFDKKMLVRLWMAEGFVKPSGGRSIEDIGEDYLNKLLSCSFFDRSGKQVVMHDLMHDLAEAVSGDFFSRLDDEHQALSISEKARYFSFASFSSVGLSTFEPLHVAKYLRTFVLFPTRLLFNQHMSSEILVAMIPQFYCLRMLSLSGYEVIELPESIGNLKQLRYLDVSGTSIKELPESVSTLCNLQSLLLSRCHNLEQLPAGTSRLVSLRHLDISDTTLLRQMPNHMSKLKYLQTLSGFVVGKHCGQGIEELRDLRHIRGKLALRRLQNISSPEVALDANLICKEYIGKLAFEYDDSGDYHSKIIEAVLENLKPHPNLEKLTIRRYPGTRFPNWLDTQCLMYKNIVKLTLEDCKNCYCLPALGQLPSLKYLAIEGMESIVVIGSEFCGYDLDDNVFPVLKELVIRDMENWKEWLGLDIENKVPFPCLEELRLYNCPELVSLPPEVGMLSCLETLHLGGCEKLKSLRNVRLPTKLGSLYISECKILESLPQEMELLNNLRELRLISCPCVKSAPKDTLPTSLQSLDVEGCESWEFPIPIEVEKMQCYSAFERLRIRDSGDPIVSFPLGGFPNLRSLELWNLQELERVYIPTGVDLMNLTSLQELTIWNCQKLRWIGKTEEEGAVDLPAPNLQSLKIGGCELVKPLLMLSGDREGLPSKLEYLHIEINNLKTVTSSHRKCQNLLKFTCLTCLALGRHVVEYFPDKGCSLPVSITELFLIDCPNLKRLNGEALKTLTSLQLLHISRCYNVECLPEEGLPPSLAGLYIWECPKLEERCKRDTGLDWPIIQHVPHVWINDELI